MNHGPVGGGRWVLAIVAAALVLIGWLAEPSFGQPTTSMSVVLAQVSPTPRPSPTPTKTAEQKLQDIERERIEREADLFEEQADQIRQQQDIARQSWRAPFEAISMIGPTLVGFGLLYLARQALNRLLPPEPPRPRPAGPAAEDDEDEDDL